jgi:PAS domain S-box-containing protein
MPEADAPARILVVDDDAGLLRLVERALKREGFNTATASSGKEAIDWLARNTAELMLLDLKLQDIEGKELVTHLASIGRSIPFIIITGQGDERVAVDMMKRGALDYLVKDVQLIEFVPTVVRRGLAQLERERRLVAAEQSSRESAERYRLLVEMAGTVVLLLGKDGTILEWSGEAERVYGYTATEVIGKNYLKLFLNDAERPGVAKELEKIYGGISTVGYENPVVTRSGAVPTFLWNATLLRDTNGQSRGALSVGHDITQRKKLEQALLDISEREQRKFGHDLHDGLGQRLTGLEMLSHGLAEDLKEHTADLAKQARRLNRELRETVTQARLISHSLAPVPLEGDGLMRGLMKLAESTSRIPGVVCRFACDAPVCIQDVTTATHLYRIAQEAVSNALKHGRARKIVITLTERAEGVELSVENNGRSLPANKPANSGMGLNVMRYRAEMIGASLAIESGKRKGVRVSCTLRKKT